MANILDQMTGVYCFLDDYLKAHPRLARWRRSPNDHPAFTDAEVLTIGLLQSALGVDSLKRAYEHVRDNYRACFPDLCSYGQWMSRLHALGEVTGHLVEAARFCNGHAAALWLMDAKPIPVCKPIRHGRARLLREAGAYFGKTSAGWFFGFKLHALVNIDGHLEGAVLTPGNWDDREVAPALGLMAGGGVVLGGLGYRRPALAEELIEEADLLLITRADVPESQRAMHSMVRQRIETVFSQLWHGFIDRVYSRSWEGLWSTIRLKLLAYNLRHAHILSA